MAWLWNVCWILACLPLLIYPLVLVASGSALGSGSSLPVPSPWRCFVWGSLFYPGVLLLCRSLYQFLWPQLQWFWAPIPLLYLALLGVCFWLSA